ncbi:MAG: hypothetical protein M9899_07655 [Bdellovibrionaceae bacterium]|nr:hypothetical protein [Pseudobdellovibrionaceae bacterium]
MKSNILAILLSGGVMLSAGAVDVPKAYANKAKDRPPVTTKTLPETAKATTKTGGAGTDTPLWKQKIVVNIKTGERTTIEDVMARKTAATSTINGIPAPGGGYYYTPGPANRPVTVPTSGAVAGSTVGGTNGLGFINQDMMGGSMILLSGASLFQPLANFGGGKNDEVCLECAKQGPYTPPASDPNLTNENTIPPEIRPGYELLVPIFNELGEFPFTVDGTYNAEYFAALYDVLMREPFSELSDLAKDEMASYCPNYSNLDDLKKKALVMLMFSNMMKNKNGKYEPRRIVDSTNNGQTEKGYGLCGIRPEFAQSRLQHDYKNVIKNRGTYQVSSSQVSRSSYALQDFGVAYSSVEDLYHAQNNIRLCVMEMHYTAVIHAQNPSGEVKPFTHKMEFLADTATKEKFKNYSLCKTTASGETPPDTSGGGTVIN